MAKRALVVFGLVLIILMGYQNCGKLANMGAALQSSSSGASGGLNQPGAPSQLVQYNDNRRGVNANALTVLNTQPMQAGDLLVLLVQNADLTQMSKTPGVAGCPCVPQDTLGNNFTRIAGTNFYYAINNANAAAGADTISVSFATNVGLIEIVFYEYSGIDTTSPIDNTFVGTTGSTFSSSISTTNSNDIILGEIVTTGSCTTWGNGWSMRMTAHLNCWATLDTSAPGTYTATGTTAGTGTINLVAFKKSNALKLPWSFIQGNGISTQSGTTLSVKMNSDQLPRDLNVVVINWVGTMTISGPGTAPHYVTDTKGNVYTLVGTVPGPNNIMQSIWFAQNILAAAAGTNSVNVSFTAAAAADMTVSEYKGSTTGSASPLDQANGNANTSALATTGSVTTVFPNELVITTVGQVADTLVTSTGAGYRLLPLQDNLTNPGIPRFFTADTIGTSPGVYSNLFNLSTSSAWISSIVTFH